MATLLIVDDDEATRHSLARLLETEGHTIHTAVDGRDALQRVVACAPDAILLDVRMPIANGLVFLRALRANARYAWTPVAVITGDYFLDQAVSDELMRLGAAIYFKPVWFSNLTEIVERLLGHNK
jgi:DNA-binding NtrC family response regulator